MNENLENCEAEKCDAVESQTNEECSGATSVERCGFSEVRPVSRRRERAGEAGRVSELQVSVNEESKLESDEMVAVCRVHYV